MTLSNRSHLSVLLIVLYASFGDAAATPASVKHTTHHVRDLGNGVNVQVFHPESKQPVFRTFGEGLDVPSSFFNAGMEENTVSFVSSQLNMDSANVSFTSGYTTADGDTFGYAKQAHNGIEFVNAAANVAFKNNKVVAFGQSFVDTANIADSKPSVNVTSVISKVEETSQGKKNEIEPTVKYLARQDGSVALAHVFQVQNNGTETWYEAYVDAHSGELLSVTDFVAHAAYRVLPVWKMDPTEGLQLLTDPVLSNASPNGWIERFDDDTQGNNAISFKGIRTITARESDDIQIFDYPYDMTVGPTQGVNIDAARTNGFYIANTYHDTLYQYGFTESAFNFQQNNFGKGGRGNDPVLFGVQDPTGVNNAGFITPPDGQSGTCRMYIFTRTTPNRDGVFQNDIPLHEMTHGLTNRMIGGGTALCLQVLESAGLGEGWSDAVAEWFIRSDTPEITDFVTGTWVTNNPKGVRTMPYSTSNVTNNLRYSDLNLRVEKSERSAKPSATRIIHLSTIPMPYYRANLLHNVYAELVGAHNFSTTARTNANGTEGNIVFLQLFVDALALQPCNPSFPQARDAWIQADASRYGSANKCLLWRVFASRGLGVGTALHVDSFTVPAGC
ncbi:hypothetical protein L218DRAFT_1000830 [Marasmius fiardii PR-910]|nr:hypothetical protein L218DRAFT_1000830 [Marasmius fiardii PR-910]